MLSVICFNLDQSKILSFGKELMAFLVSIFNKSYQRKKQTSCSITRHNSANSVPTSNLVCITEVAIRTTLCIAVIIYYTCSLVTDSQCTCYKYVFNKRF